MFEVVGQDIISGNMGFIGTDSDRLYRMGAAEKTEDVTVTGNPAVLDNATGKPFKDLHIYGRSEQITTTGAQILKLVDREPVTICGLTWQIKNQCISVNGTATDEGKATDFYICGDKNVYEDADFSDGEITVSANLPKDIVMFVVKNDGAILTHIESNKNVGSFEHTSGSKYRILLRTAKNGAICDNVIKAMFNTGSTALPWEPYTGGKPSPSPDYPQEIVSAGEDGNLNVMVRGKNIFPGPEQPKTVEKNGLTFSYKDGMYTLVGTSNTDTWFNIYPNIRNSTSTADTGGTIHSIGKVAVANGLKNESCTISIRDANIKDKTENITSSNNKKHLSFDTNGAFIHVRPGTYSETFTLMIVDENQAEDYEPYHTPQTLTLSTPNGLPGIPVASGGNYTDENGKQWICDEVDLGRGVYVQRIASFMINAKNANDIFVTNLYTHVTVAVNARISTPEKTIVSSVTVSTRSLFCEALPWMEDEWAKTVNSAGFVENDYIDFTIENSYLGLSEASTNDERKAALVKYFTDKPCQIVYRIATPIETPLTAAEIAAYKSLRTYRGTTIVEAEDKAGISVTYKRNAKAAEKEVNILHADLMAEMEELDENSEIV